MQKHAKNPLFKLIGKLNHEPVLAEGDTSEHALLVLIQFGKDCSRS